MRIVGNFFVSLTCLNTLKQNMAGVMEDGEKLAGKSKRRAPKPPPKPKRDRKISRDGSLTVIILYILHYIYCIQATVLAICNDQRLLRLKISVASKIFSV